MRDRAGRIRALALTLVLALGLLPSAVLAQSAVDGGQAESMADTQDAVVEAVADADQDNASDEEDLPDVVVPAEEEDIVADDDATEEAEANADDISESAAEPVGDGAVQSAEEPAAEPEAPSDGEPAATRGGENTTAPESREAGHTLTVRLGENSSQVQGMSVSYYGSDGEEKTSTGTTEITVTDADENNSDIYVQLTMQDSTPYAIEASIAPSGGRFDFFRDGSIRIYPHGDLGSDTVITLDLAAMHEIKTGHTDPPVSGMRYDSHFGHGDTTAAPAGTEVTPRCYQPEEGYRLKSYTVTNDATGETASYEADQPFTMPDSSVTVTPTILYGFTERTVTVRLGENSSQVQGMSMRYYDSNREWKTVEGTTEVTATDVADKYIIYNDTSGDMAFKYDTVSVTVTMKDGRRYFAKVDPAIDNSWFGSRLSSWDGTLRLDSHTIISDTVFTLYDFVAASYGIEVGETEHGSISSLGISYGDTYSSFSASEDAILAPEGAQISLSPRPDEGYYLKSCTVTNNTTGETTSYEADQPFTMPDSSVTVTPIFAPIVPIVDTIEIGNVSVDIAASDGELSALVPFTGTVDPDAPYTLTQERWVRMSDGRYSSPDAELMPRLDKPLTSLSVGDELSYSFYVKLRPGCELADQVTVRVTTAAGETYTRTYGRSGKLAGDIMRSTYDSTYTLAYDVFRVTVGEAKPPAITVTIALDANGGDASSVPGSQDKVVGEDLTLPTSTPARPDTTAPGYTVSYDANGGSGAPSAQTATVTTSYSFTGWNTLQDGTGDPYEAGGTYSADADATLYAQWSATAVAQPLVVAGTPVRDGHTFKGWNTSADGSGTPYAVGDPIDPAEDLTLYAQWEQDATAPTEDTYAVSSGDNGTWTQGSGEDYELTVDRVGDNDACFEHFRAVELDGRLLSEDEYEARSGSTIITLKAHVLQELSPGKHTVTVVFDDDRVDIDFTVKAASSGGSSEPGGTTPETPGTPGTPSTAPATTGGSAQAPDAEKPQATPRTGDGSPSLLAFGLALASIVMACAGFGVRSMVSKERL